MVKKKYELEGRKCYDIFPGEQCNTSRCPVQRMIKRKRIFKTEVDKKIKDGVVNSFAVSISPLMDKAGDLYGVIESFTNITKKKKIREGLHFFRDLLKSSIDMILVIDPESSALIDFNFAVTKSLGYSQKKLRDMCISDINLDVDDIGTWHKFVKKLRVEKASVVSGKLMKKDGSMLPVEMSFSTRVYNKKEYVIAIFRDITERERVLKLLKESKEKLSLALSGANLGCWDWNIQTGYLEVDDVWLEMLGYQRGDLKAHYSCWEKLLHPVDKKNTMVKIEKHLKNPQWDYVTEFRIKTKENKWKWIQARGRICSYDEDGNPERMIGVHLDIDKRKNMEKKIRVYNRKLKHLAYFDALTQVLNRKPFIDISEKIIEKNKREGNKNKVAFMFLDLDNFKNINDTYGHNVGDEILKYVGTKIKEVTRKSDFACRLGGDEFVICMQNIPDKNSIKNIASQIIEEINKQATFDGIDLKVALSAGIAVYPDDGESVSQLLMKSDMAMYDAKKLGGLLCSFYKQQ